MLPRIGSKLWPVTPRQTNCLNRSLRSQRGATMVESAVGLVCLLPLLLGGMSLAISSYKIASVQFVLTKAARFGITSETLSQSDPLGLIEGRVIAMAQVVGVPLTPAQITICPAATTCSSDSLGNNTDLLVMRVDYPLQIFQRNVPVNFNASVLVRREPI